MDLLTSCRRARGASGADGARTLVVALAIGFLSGAAPAAAQQEAAFEAYLAEMNDPSPDYVAVSSHYRHAESGACLPDGCVLMGPTDDKEACDRWSAAYNRIDPYDHTRCIELILER